ncbi:jg16214 [Pararge aegeria aegeria]|uniref:Jg16214 protein n=1 Tax=Pararge aegeria aegeria TaxID=348720 RepID=A0A8S4RUS6_9NEOP|nr:jg16214 [Pararge aegeria aegeria]
MTRLELNRTEQERSEQKRSEQKRIDKRPEGMTIVPWSMGHGLVWDATCVDTLAASHLPSTSQKAAAAAESSQVLKRRKYP